MQRIQRTTLFGGGIAITATLMALTILSLWQAGKDTVSDRQQVFDAENTTIKITLRGHAIDLANKIQQIQTTWRSQPKADASLLKQFISNHGHALFRPQADRPPILMLSAEASPPARLTHYLGLAEQSTSSLCGGDCELRKLETSYLYSPDRQFLAIAAISWPTSPPVLRDRRLWHAFFQQMPSPAAVGSQIGSEPIWLGIPSSPLSGHPSIRLAQTAIVNDEPIAILARDIRIDTLLNTWRPDIEDESTLLVSPDGKLQLGIGPLGSNGTQLAARLHDMRLPAMSNAVSDLHYQDGLFILRARLPSPGWIHIQVFSRQALFNDLKLPLIIDISALSLALVGLWALILLLNKRIFQPAFVNAQRIFESENLNRLMVATAPSGLALLSVATGKVLFENEVMKQWGQLGHAAHPPLYLQLQSQHLSATAARQAVDHWDIQYALADGGAMELHCTAVATRYLGIGVLLCNVVDITARKAIERELEAARQTAEAASQAKTSFIAMVSHEIRTPLHAIASSLELLGRSDLSPHQRQRLAIANRSSEALLAIINDILDLTKVEAGLMTMERTCFDLSALSRETASGMEPLALAKGLAFSCMIDDGLAPAYLGDPGRIRQIMMNLLGNAIKFTLRGEVMLEVYRQDDSRSDSHIIIGVTDSGIGIPAEYHQQVFTEFTQADASVTRRFGGSGLGLSLCKKLTELHGGMIEFTSTPGLGSTFTVTLPLEICSAPAQLSEQPSNSKVGFTNTRILVVDDHPTIRALIQDQLRELGYEADAVGGGMEALEGDANHDYALILTDLNMPGMSGFILAQTLRDKQFSGPIIAITAHVGDTLRQLCAQSGITDLVLKPFTLAELDRIVRKHITSPVPATPQFFSAQNIDESAALTRARREELLTTLNQSILLILDALPRSQSDIILEQLHTTKGAFAMFGLKGIVDACEQIEKAVKAGDNNKVITRLTQLKSLARNLKLPPQS
ncbi:hybrid sensor histidine kinase/response regulator [Chromobacterium amazonense]|uniref:hybrid sensor histidine kinase/response regulator n=1 Tax=Chromobacterium amazonense TaxID=1382803 RepID=UPI0031F6D325